MDLEVKYQDQKSDSLPISLGRNGDVKTAGVAIMDLDNQVVVQPINSRDGLGRGFVGLPKDPKDLRAVAAKLNHLAENLEVDLQVEKTLSSISTGS